MVALVAALAALAVAGRLILAPIPNVVATTDVALITGYALGGAPGFAVGALAAPVSNLWLGQGPWTPWQMAGWGMCGLSGRRAGRLHRPARRAAGARMRLRVRRLRLRRAARPLGDGQLRGRAVARPLPGAVGAGAAVQRRPRRRQLRDRARRGAGAGADDRALPRADGVPLARRARCVAGAPRGSARRIAGRRRPRPTRPARPARAPTSSASRTPTAATGPRRRRPRTWT